MSLERTTALLLAQEDTYVDVHTLIKGVGSYLLLNTIFQWPHSVVLPIVFCGKSTSLFVCSILLLANPEARSTRYNTTHLKT